MVSLVPSATETLLALGVTPVACTRFCEQPGLRTVGGTKNPDVATIVELDPDLVVMNDEENRREDFDALRDAGVTVHSMSPRDVADVLPAVRRARRRRRRRGAAGPRDRNVGRRGSRLHARTWTLAGKRSRSCGDGPG